MKDEEGETDPKRAPNGTTVSHRKVAEHAKSDEESAATVKWNNELTEMCKYMEKINVMSEAAHMEGEKKRDKERQERC